MYVVPWRDGPDRVSLQRNLNLSIFGTMKIFFLPTWSGGAWSGAGGGSEVTTEAVADEIVEIFDPGNLFSFDALEVGLPICW